MLLPITLFHSRKDLRNLWTVEIPFMKILERKPFKHLFLIFPFRAISHKTRAKNFVWFFVVRLKNRQCKFFFFLTLAPLGRFYPPIDETLLHIEPHIWEYWLNYFDHSDLLTHIFQSLHTPREDFTSSGATLHRKQTIKFAINYFLEMPYLW